MSKINITFSEHIFLISFSVDTQIEQIIWGFMPTYKYSERGGGG